MNKKVIRINNTELGLEPNGCVSIDTHMYITDTIEYGYYLREIIATCGTNCGETFSWVGNFIYRYETAIDIDMR